MAGQTGLEDEQGRRADPGLPAYDDPRLPLPPLDTSLSEDQILTGRRSHSSAMEHPLIVQGSSNPMAIGQLNALNAFSLKDCPGVVKNLEDIVRKPNTFRDGRDASERDLADEVVRCINGKTTPHARRFPVGGRLVHEGYIQFIAHSGRTEAVTAGKWLMMPGGSWGKIAHLSEPLMVYGNVTIVWVQRRQIGLAWESGREVLLEAGLHAYNNPAFIYERSVDRNADYIQHGTFHIVRVPRGKFGKVWVASATGGPQPRLLAEGLHCLDSGLFSYEGMVAIAERHIMHGGLQLLRVPSGHIAKINNDGQPQFLGPGFHFFESTLTQYVSLVSSSDKVITHGSLTLVRVSKGEVVVAWLHNEPLVLEKPGTYGFEDPKFVYVRHQPASDKIVGLGEKKVVKVRNGEVGISHQHGTLRILRPGRHMLDDTTQSIGGFLPTEDADRLVAGYVQFFNCSGCSPLPYKFVDPAEHNFQAVEQRPDSSLDSWMPK
mmetsp:Transcript_31430/g.57010  ORF Transcript_31430/g.57010 Transcript_31430/m.57010 type:complete len:489 (+) Transcript_31430:51-1517(+)